MMLVMFSLPGRPAQALHFVVDATARAAAIASHSCGDTTATRLFFVTTSAFGYLLLSNVPADTSVEPTAAGRTVRACSMPGRRTSPTHSVFAATLSRTA